MCVAALLCTFASIPAEDWTMCSAHMTGTAASAPSMRKSRVSTLHDVLLDAFGGWKDRQEEGEREVAGMQERETSSLDNACAALRFSKPQDLAKTMVEVSISSSSIGQKLMMIPHI